MILIILFIAACFLAYSNGANDNFKGVATLFGSGATNYKKAIAWATATTFAGSMAAIFLASSLVKNFSGKGLVPDTLIQSPEFAISIALGAAITVFLATKTGMPISTTHSLVGALFGSGVIAVGTAFNFSKLGSTFLMPLIVSPLMAAIVSFLVYIVFRKLRKAMGLTKQSWICVGSEKIPVVKTINANTFVTIESETPKTIKLIIALGVIAWAVYQFIEGYIGNGIALIFLSLIFIFLYFRNELILLAFLRLRKQDFAGTQRWLLRIKNPESALTKKQVGYYHYLFGIITSQTNLTQAEKYFKKALSIGLSMDHDLAMAKLSLAGIVMQKRRKREATTLLNEAKKLDKQGMLAEQIKMMQQQMKKI